MVRPGAWHDDRTTITGFCLHSIAMGVFCWVFSATGSADISIGEGLASSLAMHEICTRTGSYTLRITMYWKHYCLLCVVSLESQVSVRCVVFIVDDFGLDRILQMCCMILFIFHFEIRFVLVLDRALDQTSHERISLVTYLQLPSEVFVVIDR